MSIDWITVAAQIVNFLVLIWLLKRFLFQPILKGIDARELEIATRLAAADEAREAAEEAARRFEAERQEMEDGKTAFLDAARAQAESERARAHAETDRLVERERADWQKQMADTRDTYASNLQAAGAQTILSLTQKVLDDLADARLEEQIAARLCARMADIGDDLRAAGKRAERALIISQQTLPPSCRAQLQQAFGAVAGDIPLTFETDETQSPGIVLQCGGARVRWTVDSYLDTLHRELETQMADRRSRASDRP